MGLGDVWDYLGMGGFQGTALIWGPVGTDGCGGDTVGTQVWGTRGDSRDLVTEVSRAYMGNLRGQQRFGDPQGQPQYCRPTDTPWLWGTPHPGDTRLIPMLRSLCRFWGSCFVGSQGSHEAPTALEAPQVFCATGDGEWGTKPQNGGLGRGSICPPVPFFLCKFPSRENVEK